jgi:NAD(P)-dependent dehydrogenase (short-subunit alcohol dehydrogenase family)
VSETEQVAVISGSAKGLGREVASQLVDAGWKVIITSRDPEEAAATSAALGSRAVALAVPLDIANQAFVTAAADAIGQITPVLDALINNAAAYVDWSETATSADLAAARAVMETNLFGAWRLTQALLPLLRESANARIVNVSSGAGSHADTAFGLTSRGGAAASYGISKAALNALTSTLATELAPEGILVNSVCPDLTATWDGAAGMGARPVSESAPGVVWAATLPAGGPTGQFFRDREPLGW